MTSSAIPSHLACPACQQVTPLPSQAALTAVVRCPHCRAQFALQDLLVDPAIHWELVDEAAPQHSDDLQRMPADLGRDSDAAEQATDQYTLLVAPAENSPGASPGAETVEMSGYEALVEQWKDVPSNEQAAEQVAERSVEEAAERSVEEAPPRKLEGPLVGDFPDDPEPEYPEEWAWRSAATLAAADQSRSPESTLQGQFNDDAAFQSFADGPTMRQRRSARHSSGWRSPVWMVLQVALGGLAAVPVSLLLMWHLLGTDVGGAAPWVAQYAPWIVPEKFHAYAPPAASAADSLPPASPSHPPATEAGLPTPGQEDTENTAADEIPTVQPRALSDVDLAADLADTANDPFPSVPHPASDYQDTSESEPHELFPSADTLVKSGRHDGGGQPDQAYTADQVYAAETADSLAPPADREDSYNSYGESLATTLDEQDAVERAADAAPTVEDPLQSVTPSFAEHADNSQESPEDLDSAALEKCFTSIRQTNSKLEEWSLAVAAKQHDMPLAQSTYSELARLALAIDELPSRDLVQQAMRGQLKPVRKQIQQKLAVRHLINQGARFWIRSHSRSASEADEGSHEQATDATAVGVAADGRYGLAVTAVIDSISPSGDGPWSTVTASSTTQSGAAAKLPLEVRIAPELIASLPEGKLSVGQKLFLLGTVSPSAEDATDDSTQPPLVANYLAPL